MECFGKIVNGFRKTIRHRCLKRFDILFEPLLKNYIFRERLRLFPTSCFLYLVTTKQLRKLLNDGLHFHVFGLGH